MIKMTPKYDLSVLIAARNEEWLAKTVEDVLDKRRGKTEVIVVADGYWPNPAIPDHPDVTMIHHEKSVGQRAGINDAARVSQAKYVMKLDAHCFLDEGFDVKLMENCEYDWTVVPAMYNLHAFNWKCVKCGNEWYQGPTPSRCYHSGESKSPNEACDNTTEFERVVVWKKHGNRRSEYMCFDQDLHFQYWGNYKDRPEAAGQLAPIMSFIGACWFMHRERYWELDGLDEKHGSWGQVGTEVACKSWLSGGKLMVNKNTWFAHLFRTQGGDFSFPYPQSGRQVENARKHSKELWRNDTWPKAKYNLRWLVEKFWPIKGWSQEALNELPKQRVSDINVPKKGIIYYTDNQLNIKIAQLSKRQTKSIGLPIVSASLKNMNDMGTNVHIKLKRGYEAYFTQILAALEASDAEIIYFCEHDWLYPPSHFDFTPPTKDTFYYNWNWWRLRASDGLAVHYDTQLVPGIVAYRELFLDYYRKQYNYLKKHNFDSKTVLIAGFEPGTHGRVPELGSYKVDRFESAEPLIDIRHTTNLTSSKWSQAEFRSQANCRNWKETKDIPGWGVWNPEKQRFS